MRDIQEVEVMIPDDLGYQSDPDIYLDPLRRAESWTEMRDHVARWGATFPDALEAMNTSRSYDWPEMKWFMRIGSKREPRTEGYARRVAAAMALWGAILMPKRLLQAGMVAATFHVPWGCALIRVLETGGD